MEHGLRAEHLPAAVSKATTLHVLGDVETDHGLTEVLRDGSKLSGVVVVGNGLDDGTSTLLGVVALEDTRADKDTVTAELHHESSISRGSNTTSSEVDNWQSLQASSLLEKVEGSLNLLGVDVKLLVAHGRDTLDLALDSALVTDSLDNVAGTGLTLGSDHSSTLRDTTKSLTEILGTTNEGDLEVVLVDVVCLVSRGENLGLIDVIDTDSLENLGLDKVANSNLGHAWHGGGLLDLLDHSGVGHTGDATLDTDIGRDLLEGHDGTSTGILGDTSLPSVDDVHDDTTLEHLCKTGLDTEGTEVGIALGSRAVDTGGGDAGAVAVSGGEDGWVLGGHFGCVCVCVRRRVSMERVVGVV